MPSESVHIADAYQQLLTQAGFTGAIVFDSPAIKPWRTLDNRQNCTWDLTAQDGHIIRFHVKRFAAAANTDDAIDAEAGGYRALESAGIPTAKLVAWGRLADHRSFLITEDLAGHQAADKLILSESDFDPLINPTADLAARLHNAGLHHRDLYLCHFFAQTANPGVDLRLIDAARVRSIPWFLRRRWLIKDLAQFWYSTLALPITDRQRQAWLARYAQQRGISEIKPLQKSIERKSGWIAAHDRRLRHKHPLRNISIPGNQPTT